MGPEPECGGPQVKVETNWRLAETHSRARLVTMRVDTEQLPSSSATREELSVWEQIVQRIAAYSAGLRAEGAGVKVQIGCHVQGPCTLPLHVSALED